MLHVINMLAWILLVTFLTTNIYGKEDPVTTTAEPVTTTAEPVTSVPDEISNEALLEDFVDELGPKIACEWMAHSDPEKLKLNLSREMNFHDVAKLAFLNKGKNLAKAMLIFPDALKDKEDVVNSMFDIFKHMCPDEYVRHDYLNIVREFVKIYLNSVEPRGFGWAEAPVWDHIQRSLKTCKIDSEPNEYKYNFTLGGLLVQEFLGDNNAMTKRARLEVQLEQAELNYRLDKIVETLWYVFTHAWAHCIPKQQSKELWGPRFKQLFFNDFLKPLEDRWTRPGDIQHFMEIIVGDYDVFVNEYNMKHCSQAAFFLPTGTHREAQLVRPIKLTTVDKGVSKFQNHRSVLV